MLARNDVNGVVVVIVVVIVVVCGESEFVVIDAATNNTINIASVHIVIAGSHC